MNPKVSVLVPVFNSRNFVSEALDSILCQNYDNIEVVVADDCSTDGTQTILQHYKDDARVKIIYNQENLGITRNCNNILKFCTGKYIALFAGDDIMIQGKLEQQVNFMEANPVYSMSYHPVEVFQTETNQILYTTRSLMMPVLKSAEDVIRRMGIPGGMSIMFRKDCMPEHGFDESLAFASDWLFQIDLAMNGEIGYLDGIYARYRKYGVNNGKNLSTYENEFLRVLRIAQAKYPVLSLACRKGEARYLAGYAFRQREREYFRNTILKAIALDQRLVYYLALALSFFPGFQWLIKISKSRFKKS